MERRPRGECAVSGVDRSELSAGRRPGGVAADQESGGLDAVTSTTRKPGLLSVRVEMTQSEFLPPSSAPVGVDPTAIS